MPAQLGREWISIRDSFIVSPGVTAVSFQQRAVHPEAPRQVFPRDAVTSLIMQCKRTSSGNGLHSTVRTEGGANAV
jgi:hypothetical protein